MVNFYDKKRFISKSTLAKLAGVSYRTFSRYLKTRQPVLDMMGIPPKAQLLPPRAVRFVCEDYCIDLPEQMQDQDDLDKTQLYKNVLIYLQHWENENFEKMRLKAKKIKNSSPKMDKDRQRHPEM